MLNEKALFLNGYGCSSKLYNTSRENFPGLSFQNWVTNAQIPKDDFTCANYVFFDILFLTNQ